WTVIAEKQTTLDAVKQASGGTSLEDDKAFADAMGKLPGETVAKFYVSGSRLTQSLGQSLGAAGAALPSANKLAYVTGAVGAKDREPGRSDREGADDRGPVLALLRGVRRQARADERSDRDHGAARGRGAPEGRLELQGRDLGGRDAGLHERLLLREPRGGD